VDNPTKIIGPSFRMGEGLHQGVDMVGKYDCGINLPFAIIIVQES
jgi:hypothetical protein